MINIVTRHQFMSYAAIGLTSNLLLYLAYLSLTLSIGIEHKTAMTVVYVTGVLLTFFANRVWSFKHRDVVRAAFVRYVIAYVLGYLLNLILLWLAVDLLSLPHQRVQAVAIVLVAICMFLLQKYWVFAPSVQRNST